MNYKIITSSSKYFIIMPYLHLILPWRIRFLVLLLTLLPGTAIGELLDTTVAVVNDEIITRSELNQATSMVAEKIRSQYQGMEQLQALKAAERDTLNKLITKKLIEQEAKKRNISISDAESREALERHLQQNKLTRQQLNEELARSGINEQQYLDTLNHQLLISKLVGSDIRSKIIIPDDKITKYYEEHYTRSLNEDEYYILQIGCSWQSDGTANSKKEAMQRAEHIRMLAASGKDFAELANKYSDLPSAMDGGSIGILKRDEIAPVMFEAVAGLQPGEISGVIETSDNYQILKLIAGGKNKK
ncbi:MAG: SurA N-terminal domain-containing protein, partial [Desulfobulbaceae bacterium]|nr:SurA N-terminal domain-containing protein [Desulfobulbaceae bacterium]